MNQSPTGCYVLHGHVPVVCEDLIEWACFIKNSDARRVAADDVGDLHVSTVFLGVDHNWLGKGPPILFETMVFRGKAALDYQERYATWDEAVSGHARAFAWVMGGMKDLE